MLDLTPETRATGTWEKPLRPFRASPPGETNEQRIARECAVLRAERVYSEQDQM